MYVIITVMDIIYRSVLYLKDDVSDIGFSPHLQAEPTQLGPTDKS
jgi:hypothetical protein